MSRKIPKKITKSYLENAALYYLQRYATSSANFRKVLMRKVEKSCRHHGGIPGDFVPLIDDLTVRYLSSGLLNDATYAGARAATLRRQGRSKQAIHAKLQIKGLKKDEIDTALSTVDGDDEEAEIKAALAHARKKKLGLFRTRPVDPKKDMAAMARAGFSFEIARKVLKYREEEENL